MDHELVPDLLTIRMDERDTVVTALVDLAPGAVIDGRGQRVTVLQPIPFGHKVAIVPIAAGEPVYKYGEVIGRATRDVMPGEHMHVHNIEGTRGRGDLTKAGN